MKFSIIVPVYNVEKYLDDCVQSILRQSFNDFELLLVDDGSKDASGMMCDKYADTDIRVKTWHRENAGVSATRNFGIEQARGEYVLFVDSDDEIADCALETLANNLNSQADVIIFGARIISDRTNNSVNPNEGYFDKDTFGEMYLEYYRKFLINSPCNKVYKLKLLKDGPRFPKSMSLGEDLLFCNEYLKLCDSFLCLSESLYLYKQRPTGSLTTKYYDHLFDTYFEHYCSVTKTKKHFSPLWDETQCAELYRFYCYYIRQAINMVGHKKNNAHEFVKYKEIKRICDDEFTRKCVQCLKPNNMYDFLLERRFAIGLYWYIKLALLKNTVRTRIRNRRVR